ncbi:hypothetical protein [Verrucomicrobium sp. BvORR034]|uniref:hypothetical protein n=1 Tax=Verrucomicrobium sp. BvORR034 TaxID=1396418 RepID=UPI000678E224|nr:hypothetical protein [Verrucomicrobium sp. BvORR034]
MMLPPPKLRELAVASQTRAENLLQQQPGRWHVISIREPGNPAPDLANALSVHVATFEDVLTPQGQHGLGPRAAHLESILRAVKPLRQVPVLIHCWAGRSRSTAVALTLIVQELWEAGFESLPLIKAAIDRLLQLNPHAVPNVLVLHLGLDLILPTPLPATLTQALMNDPRIIANRQAFLAEADEPAAQK